MIDINLSPDISALWCYALVGALGVWGARRQVKAQLAGIPGIWAEPRTQILFLIYAALPVVLFWFLERSGAITDTSLIAAAFVGLGYQQIIAGEGGTIKAPGDLSRIWAPFQSYADSIALLVRESSSARARRNDDYVIKRIAASDENIVKLTDLAKERLPDAAIVDDQLKRIGSGARPDGSSYARERQARILYGLMLSVPDRNRLLREAGLISTWLYFTRGLTGAYLRVAFLWLVVAVLCAVVYRQTFPSSWQMDYYVWRIGKANATATDQYRSRRTLFQLLLDGGQGQETARLMSVLLRHPGISAERVDLVVQTLLEARANASPKPALTTAITTSLTDALHATNVDTRRRINDALITIAVANGKAPDPTLMDWKPANGDPAALLEERVRQWRRYWGDQPA